MITQRVLIKKKQQNKKSKINKQHSSYAYTTKNQQGINTKWRSGQKNDNEQNFLLSMLRVHLHQNCEQSDRRGGWKNTELE